MTVKLTYEVLAKMFRCPDCRTDPPIDVIDVPGLKPPGKKIRVNHSQGCPKLDRHAAINTYMPDEVDDDDLVLRRLIDKDDL